MEMNNEMHKQRYIPRDAPESQNSPSMTCNLNTSAVNGSNKVKAHDKNTDCYYFYYSTCSKGPFCSFRHEPAALGSETVCKYWLEGICTELNCKFRHLKLTKRRNVIPCYHENQPGGCQKSHCPFKHSLDQVSDNQDIDTSPEHSFSRHERPSEINNDTYEQRSPDWRSRRSNFGQNYGRGAY